MTSFRKNRVTRPLALSTMAFLTSSTAMAETEIEELRRELAEQRALIELLLQAQKNTPTYVLPPVSVDAFQVRRISLGDCAMAARPVAMTGRTGHRRARISRARPSSRTGQMM